MLIEHPRIRNYFTELCWTLFGVSGIKCIGIHSEDSVLVIVTKTWTLHTLIWTIYNTHWDEVIINKWNYLIMIFDSHSKSTVLKLGESLHFYSLLSKIIRSDSQNHAHYRIISFAIAKRIASFNLPVSLNMRCPVQNGWCVPINSQLSTQFLLNDWYIYTTFVIVRFFQINVHFFEIL